ncbi:MAG: hypothetical protein AAF135_22130 [Bacteroidota bacterium]
MEDEVIIQISDYLAGDMEGEARAAFEARLLVDHELNQAVETQRLHIALLRAQARAERKMEIRVELEAFKQSQKAPKVWPLWIGLAVAAAVVLLFLFVQPTSSTLTPEQMASAYSEPFSPQQVRGEEEQENALTYYRAGAYTDFLQVLDSMSTSASEGNLWNMYQAEALRLTGECEKAWGMYEALTTDPTFRDAAAWRQVLCGLELGKKEKVYELLQEMAGKDHYRRAVAGEMLEVWE